MAAHSGDAVVAARAGTQPLPHAPNPWAGSLGARLSLLPTSRLTYLAVWPPAASRSGARRPARGRARPARQHAPPALHASAAYPFHRAWAWLPCHLRCRRFTCGLNSPAGLKVFAAVHACTHSSGSCGMVRVSPAAAPIPAWWHAQSMPQRACSNAGHPVHRGTNQAPRCASHGDHDTVRFDHAASRRGLGACPCSCGECG